MLIERFESVPTYSDVCYSNMRTTFWMANQIESITLNIKQKKRDRLNKSKKQKEDNDNAVARGWIFR